MRCIAVLQSIEYSYRENKPRSTSHNRVTFRITCPREVPQIPYPPLSNLAPPAFAWCPSRRRPSPQWFPITSILIIFHISSGTDRLDPWRGGDTLFSSIHCNATTDEPLVQSNYTWTRCQPRSTQDSGWGPSTSCCSVEFPMIRRAAVIQWRTEQS